MDDGTAARHAARRRGIQAEEAAAARLTGQGWRILDRNWTGGGGELDLVVRKGDRLRFVEVKHRAEDGREVISRGQVRRLRSCARAWMQAQPTEWWTEACFWLCVSTGATPHDEWLLDPF